MTGYLIGPIGVLPAVVVVTTTAWNPLDKNSFVTLSNGNLTGTILSIAGGGNHYVRGVASHSTGKYYWSHHVDTGAANWSIGFANASETNLAGVFSNNGVGLGPSGDIWINGVNTNIGVSVVTGDTVDVAVDFGNTAIWYRVNGGSWNGNGTANPATNTGGVDFSGVKIAAGPYFPYLNLADQANEAQTANFGGSAFTNAAPSGFGNW